MLSKATSVLSKNIGSNMVTKKASKESKHAHSHLLKTKQSATLTSIQIYKKHSAKTHGKELKSIGSIMALKKRELPSVIQPQLKYVPMKEDHAHAKMEWFTTQGDYLLLSKHKLLETLIKLTLRVARPHATIASSVTHSQELQRLVTVRLIQLMVYQKMSMIRNLLRRLVGNK